MSETIDKMTIEYPKISEELFNNVELGDILYHSDIPNYFSENFPNVKSHEELMKFRRQYKCGHFKNELDAGFRFSKTGIVRFVSKPVGFSLQPYVKDNQINHLLKCAYPNGAKVQTSDLEHLGINEDEFVDNMNTIHIVDCAQKVGEGKFGNFVYHIGNIRPMAHKIELEPAQKLIDELGIFKSLFYALHMGICKDTIAVMLPRFITMFTFPFGLDNNRPCVAQFTCPSTGKSTFIFKKTALLKAHYINEVPTISAIVGNCATGFYGYAKIFNILDFDEFEKYKAGEWNEVSQCFYTGMYNSVWKRDKSTRDGSIMQYRNEVSVNFHGNVDILIKSNAREALKHFLTERKDKSPTAFDERLTIVSVIKKCQPMQSMVWDKKTIRHPVFRGLIKLIQDRIDVGNFQSYENLQGRYLESWNKIYLFLDVLLGKELNKCDLKVCAKEILYEGISTTLIEALTCEVHEKIDYTDKVVEPVEEKQFVKQETAVPKKTIEELEREFNEIQKELEVEVEMIVEDDADEVEEIDEVTDVSYYDKENIQKRKHEISSDTLKVAEAMKLKQKYKSGKLM